MIYLLLVVLLACIVFGALGHVAIGGGGALLLLVVILLVLMAGRRGPVP